MNNELEQLLRPKAQWGAEKAEDAGSLIWWSRLDGRYQIEVHDASEEVLRALGVDAVNELTDQGILCIFDHDNQDTLVFAERVGLSYGALFGPDIADVAAWQDRVIDFVDSQ